MNSVLYRRNCCEWCKEMYKINEKYRGKTEIFAGKKLRSDRNNLILIWCINKKMKFRLYRKFPTKEVNVVTERQVR